MLIERSRSRLASVLAGALLLSLLAATPVLAQQDVPPQAVPQQAPPVEGQAPAPAQAAPAPTDRVGRLEQQIADLQAMVAALESLLKTRPDVTLPQEGAAGDGGQGVGNAAGLTARIDAIETQMGALSSQLELMTQQLGALEARIGGGGDAPQQLAPPQAEEPEAPMAPPPSGDGPLPELPGR
jgi:TolA-binding protein